MKVETEVRSLTNMEDNGVVQYRLVDGATLHDASQVIYEHWDEIPERSRSDDLGVCLKSDGRRVCFAWRVL